MNPHQITDAEYAAALVAGRVTSQDEVRARAVRYVSDRDAIEVVINQGAGLLIPRQWIGALQNVSPEDLRNLDVWPDGSAIEIDDRDIVISVHGLVTAILPWIIPARVIGEVLARRGG